MRKRTSLYGLLILVMIFSGTMLALAADQYEMQPRVPDDGAAYLYTGSPLILSDGTVKMLDSTNPDLGATVIQSRTLLPLRAISEYFGAEVAYDQIKKAAIIKFDGTQYDFPIGSNQYFVVSGQGKTAKTMDTKSIILDGRTMVPLRVICEEILGKKVSYFERVIAVSDRETDLRANPELVAAVKAKIGEAVKAGTMKELERIFSEAERSVIAPTDAVNGFGAAVEDASAAMESAEASPQNKSQSSSDGGTYSTTNVQVAGIDEADIVKTDGTYLYLAGNNVVRIVGVDQGKLSDETAIRLAAGKNVSEIYIDGSRLVILGTKYDQYEIMKEPTDMVLEDSALRIMPPYYPSRTYSFTDVYDITNPLRPIFLKGHEMEGSYQTSRKNGDIVYMVTNSQPYGGIILPMMRDTAVSNQTFSMKLSDVMIMPKHPSHGYLIISAINVRNEEKTEVEAITAFGSTMYMNESSMYLAFQEYTGGTSIIRFDLEGMKVGYAGSGTVPGYLLNQFSMDEYNGNLRVATTVWETSSNSLFILDGSMNIIGAVEDLAKGESIYSVRFLGDKGYIVTFRTIDPLFVFDLSDPENPVKTGELKVPGFSSYLHPVGEDLILGIGADTYEIYRRDSSGKEVVVGIRQGGIKFSLFDISDMGKPKEISKYVIGDSGSSSEALYNHKAIMIDPQEEKVAIDAYLNNEYQENGYRQGAIVMSYAGNTLSLKGVLESEPSGVYGNDIPYARRILYIGDELYYIQDGRITSYNYDSLKQIDTLVLQ